jgi:homoserine O-acetyltransferase/O-succinyltransferase
MAVHLAARGSIGTVSTKYVGLFDPLSLDCGRTLYPVRIAYEIYGDLSPARDNVVLVCHALSGDAHAAGWSADGEAPSAVDGIGAEEKGIRPQGGLGWWDSMIGPGKAFDTDRYCVICTNVLGGCRGTTGPASINPSTGRPHGSDFPVITVGDMVRAQARFLDQLGIETLLSASGGSLGGMQAMEWTVAFPKRIRSCIVTAGTARLDSRGVAWEAIARNAIMGDPDWQGGQYYGTGRFPGAGLGVGRMVGHVTYLSGLAMEEKFGRRLRDRDVYSYTIEEPDFEVESYLRYQASTFAQRFDPNSYLYISRALTYFDLARTHGLGSLARAMEKVLARYLLISFSSDWLYPTHDSVELLRALKAAGKEASHHELPASYGHDSFLLDSEQQTPLIARFLDSVSRDR